MALSKTVKARIRWNKEFRKRMWRESQLYGPQARYFAHVRLSISFNVSAARRDEFGEEFFPVIRIPAEHAHEVIDNMANGA